MKQIQIEQSVGHVVQKQAKPLFLSKLVIIASYIDRHLQQSASATHRFVLARDQAVFKLLFFGGDRAHDLGLMLIQELRALPGGRGYVIKHTWGKTHRVNKPNVFTIFRNPDMLICPVRALETYLATARELGISLDAGFLFRAVKQDSVRDSPLEYQTIYCRLRSYLVTLGIDEGETPHSLRGACAISLRSLVPNVTGDGGAQNHQQLLMKHVGWASASSANHYSREDKLGQAAVASRALATPSSHLAWSNIEEQYFDESNLPKCTL